MARVLIVGLNYLPEVSGNAPYTADTAEHLAGRGHDVTVLTGMPHYPEWRVRRGYRGRFAVTEWIGGVRVVRRAHYVPPRQSALHRAAMEGTSVLTGSLTRLAPPPDVIIGVIPQLSGGVLARLASARTGAPYGLIFQDLIGRAASQSGVSGGRTVASATSAAEGFLARGASAVGIVAPGFRPYLLGHGVAAARIVDLSNWSRAARSSADRGATRERLGWGPGDVIVLHAGNMGAKQGLDQVIEAAATAPATAPIRFVLMGDGNQRDKLERKAAGLRNVEFRPFEPEAVFPDALAAADVLLLSERPSVKDMSLPSKLTAYLTAGRPLVAAVPDGGTRQLLERTGAARIVDAGRPSAIVGAIVDLMSDRAAADELATAGVAFAERELSPDRALDRIDRFVERLLHGRTVAVPIEPSTR